MEKTPEEMRKEAADLLRRANEIEGISEKQKPTSSKPQAKDAKTPDYGPWTETSIAKSTDKKQK